jgi:hypothetical protein
MQTKVKFTNKQQLNHTEKTTTKRPFIATSTKLVYSPTSLNEEKLKVTSPHLPLLTTYYQTQHFIQNNALNPEFYSCNLTNFNQKQHQHQVYYNQINVS